MSDALEAALERRPHFVLGAVALMLVLAFYRPLFGRASPTMRRVPDQVHARRTKNGYAPVTAA